MKLDLRDDQISLLDKTCQEEVKYYERCVLTDPTLKGQAAIDEGNDFLKQEINKKLGNAIAKATMINIKEYRQISDKLANKNTDFDRHQLDKIRMMLVETSTSYEKHILVKKQIDGTVTPNYVNKILLIAYNAARRVLLDSYDEILVKVKEGLKE
ncbi:MAG TPA: hypothetical protein VF220_01520 [Nitrososphaeraceae archaeon]